MIKHYTLAVNHDSQFKRRSVSLLWKGMRPDSSPSRSVYHNVFKKKKQPD
jgi:hypothetical protein